MAKKQYLRKKHWVRKYYIYWPERGFFHSIYGWRKRKVALYDSFSACGRSASIDNVTIFRKKVTCKSCLRIMSNG